MFDRIEQAFAAASGHEAMIKALDERIAEYVNEGWSFDCSYVWAALVNPGNLPESAIEVRISNLISPTSPWLVRTNEDEHAL